MYDYRGTYIPGHLGQHPLAQASRNDALHACPTCPLGRPAPLCPVCLGAGLLTTDRLDRYAAETFAAARRESGLTPGRH